MKEVGADDVPRIVALELGTTITRRLPLLPLKQNITELERERKCILGGIMSWIVRPHIYEIEARIMQV